MAVNTKPRYRSITIEVKPNPIFKTPEEKKPLKTNTIVEIRNLGGNSGK